MKKDQRKNLLRGRGKKKDTISSKEVLFSKAIESSSKTTPEITSKYESESESESELSDDTKKVLDKRSAVKGLKKKLQPMTSSIPDLSLAKKADSSIEKLLLTLIEEVKGLK
ncbi:hypothetical protein Tco_0094956, partial [Tanacetum coccineum]